MATDLTRRSFYGFFIQVLGGAIAAVVAAPAAAYLLLKPKAAEASSDLLEIADLSSVAVGKPRQVLFTRTRVDGWKQIEEKTSTWLVKDERGDVTAFAPACTHLACPYHWDTDSNSFLCPCHSSVFDVTGKVLGGPAPRPLDRMLVKIENGKVLVDPNQQPKATTA